MGIIFLNTFLILASVLGVIFGNQAVALISLAGGLIGFFYLWQKLGPQVIDLMPHWLKESCGPAIIIIVALGYYSRLLLGDLPLNHDHPNMMLRAFSLFHDPNAGSLLGYSLTNMAGGPSDMLYPIGADLLVNIFRWLTFNIISWKSAYGLTLFFVIISYSLCLYFLGRRFVGIFAGLIAGILGLMDHGEFLSSGWEFNLLLGVWSMGLSFTSCLGLLLALDNLCLKPTRRNFLWATLIFSFALLCHPMSNAILGLLLPPFFLVFIFSDRWPSYRIWLPKVMLVFGLGLGLAAFWYLPFLSRGQWYQPLADSWLNYKDHIVALLKGTMLSSFMPLLIITGVLGFALGIATHNRFALYLFIVTSLSIFVSSNDFLIQFAVLDHFPAVGQLQMRRFSYITRTFIILGVGVFIQSIIYVTQKLAQEKVGSAFIRRALLACALAPILFYIPQTNCAEYFIPGTPLRWASDCPRYKTSFRSFHFAVDYFRKLKQKEPSSLGRVALFTPSEHDHFLFLFPIYTGLPVFKLGGLPQNNYKFRFFSHNREVWKAINISHLISLDPLNDPDLEPVLDNPSFHVYRFRDFNPSPVSLKGAGKAEVLLSTPEKLQIRLQQTSTESKLLIHRLGYALWQATRNGVTLPMNLVSIGDSPAGFMQVPAQDGIIELSYRRRLPEKCGIAISIISLILLAFVLYKNSFGGIKTKFVKPILAYLILILALWLFSRYPNYNGRHFLTTFNSLLDRGKISAVLEKKNFDYPKKMAKGAFLAPVDKLPNVEEKIVTVGGQLRDCILLPTVAVGSIKITFNTIAMGSALEGYYGFSDNSEKPQPNNPPIFKIFENQKLIGNFSAGESTKDNKGIWTFFRVKTLSAPRSLSQLTFQLDSPVAKRYEFCWTAAVIN